MKKVVELQPRKHVYEVDRCAGCSEVIQGDYTELGLPSGDGKTVKHIALCEACSGAARKEGVI